VIALQEKEVEELVRKGADGLLDMMAQARLAASEGASRPFTCGITNAKSGRCRENCRFCAQSVHHSTDAPVYPLLPTDELLRHAERIAAAGADYCGFVMSGTAPTPEEFDRLCEAAVLVTARVPVKLCASLGLLGAEEAVRLKQAGFTSYHHNIETAPSFYSEVCPSHVFAERAQTVRNAKAAGLRVCCGGLFGLGETWEHRLELSRTLEALDVDSIPVNFLSAIPGTPLERQPVLPPEEALAIVAALRLLHPARDIVVCGGRGRALGRFETLLFPAGANGLMIGDYLTTSGGAMESDKEMLRVLGVKGKVNNG
jgi:biotin synthase